MRVGLFGGSFNPPHEGHAHVARTALRRLGLDRVIWLVSPGNPLKGEPAPMADRLAAVRKFATGPKMIVSDVETRLGLRYTVDTVRALQERFPGVEFVWVMGSDNLSGLHRWKQWRRLIKLIPMVVIPRPGFTVRSAPARRSVKVLRLHAPLNDASSTALRARASVTSS
ncbi:MAG: nicotinic acid mononucleotide adenylyltransferase [Caulobacteraceae bacterium]|nr:nicotinic acid mononucleotide adenylyltransferase [Caulobacteraceae bacterium]